MLRLKTQRDTTKEIVSSMRRRAKQLRKNQESSDMRPPTDSCIKLRLLQLDLTTGDTPSLTGTELTVLTETNLDMSGV